MEIQFSFDDGHELDRKIVELLDRYGFTGIFYVPINSWGFEHLHVYKNHRVGAHTVSHPSDLKLLDDVASKNEIFSSKDMLEQALGYPVTSFCYPRGRYSSREVEYVKQAGFEEARTTTVLKTDYQNAFKKPTTVHMYPKRKEYEGSNWNVVAKDILKNDPQYFHIWGHSWEIEEWRQWGAFERFLIFLDKEINNEDRNSVGE